MKKILFVCTANIDRSPTAEEMLKGKEGIEVKSAGIRESILPRPTTVLNEDLIRWADQIFVMEKEHRDFVTENFPWAEKKIIVLDIPDTYIKNEPQLRSILRQRLSGYGISCD